MRLDPLLTAAPETGARRPVTKDLLREVFLAPLSPALDLKAALSARRGPWSESLLVAPDETTAAVEAALVRLMRATRTLDPNTLRPETLPEGRTRDHLTALQGLWRDLGRPLPPLDTVAHVLSCRAEDALEPLPIVDPGCRFADPVEQALTDHLSELFGTVSAQTCEPPRIGQASGALGHVQRGLGCTTGRVAPDETLTFYALRDPREEAEFAAALAQLWLDNETVAQGAEIGVLAPDDPVIASALEEAFGRVGLPLSGLPDAPPARDAAGDLLSAALAVLQGPVPRTALATLLAHPAMPWGGAQGRRMAREVMERGAPRDCGMLDETGRAVLETLRPAETAAQVRARLFALSKALRIPLGPRIGVLSALFEDPLDWQRLFHAATSRPVPAGPPALFVEGVTLMQETALPWRPVRRLIVLGLSGRTWPRLPAADPMFTEGEIAQLWATGLKLPGRRQYLDRGLALFRRQLSAATEGAACLASARDMRGDPLTPSTVFTVIAPLLGAREPADLLQAPRAEVATSAPSPRPDRPVLPASGLVHLHSDLLRLREDEDGPRVPQSPSRLETLLVSPLAWLLGELGAKDRTWAPETLDVLTLGTLIHEVLEALFVPGAPLPPDAEIATAAPAALAQAIRRQAPFLSAPDWATERESLTREATQTARAWARFLEGAGAEVLHNEIDLKGDHGGLLIAGRADCLLRLNGRVVVVDHKRSSSHGRRDRMRKGWDLQVALYRAMLERPSAETPIARGDDVVCAYHTTLDASVLTDAAGIPGADAFRDISGNAMTHLADLVAEVGAGTVRLNCKGDLKRLEKDCGIKAYALDDPFLAALMLPEDAQ